MTSPYDKGVREQHYFSVRMSVCALGVHPSVCHANLSYTTGRNLTTSFHG